MSTPLPIPRSLAVEVGIRGEQRRGVYARVRYIKGVEGVYTGVTIPVKVLRLAHERNHLRRRYRPLLKELLSPYTSLALLCYPHKNAQKAPLTELRADLMRVLHTISS